MISFLTSSSSPDSATFSLIALLSLSLKSRLLDDFPFFRPPFSPRDDHVSPESNTQLLSRLTRLFVTYEQFSTILTGQKNENEFVLLYTF